MIASVKHLVKVEEVASRQRLLPPEAKGGHCTGQNKFNITDYNNGTQ